MLRRRPPLLLLASAVGLLWAMVPAASAQEPGVVIAESGDAGSVPATAQVISTPVDQIIGSLDTLDQEDLYQLCLAGGSTFSATTAGSQISDTQLFLFDAAGRGVFANDDNAEGLQSTLPAGISLTPTQGGIYYLGVSSFDADPLSAAGPIFEGEVLLDGVRYWVPASPGGDEPVSDWTFFGTYTGGYQVQLTGTASGCLPTSKSECKNSGWRTFGTMFKNEGRCVAFVNQSS